MFILKNMTNVRRLVTKRPTEIITYVIAIVRMTTEIMCKILYYNVSFRLLEVCKTSCVSQILISNTKR